MEEIVKKNFEVKITSLFKLVKKSCRGIVVVSNFNSAESKKVFAKLQYIKKDNMFLVKGVSF